MNLRRLILLIAAWACGMQLRAAELRLHLEPPPTGSLVCLLFDSPNTFGDLRDPVITAVPAAAPDGGLAVTGIPPGEYALLVYLDENGNGRIDKNFIGIPREPLGFANRYQPKGPPSFSRATVILRDEADVQRLDVSLYRPLGRRGRIGAGVGVIARSSPYRDYDGGVYQWIPAITYTGNRLQWFGPQLRCGLVGSGRLRLALTGEYRIGVYEESGSPYLAGMGDAESTVMAGLAVQAELPGGLDLSVGGSGDILNRIGGFEARAEVGKSFQIGILRLSPGLAVNWMDENMAANDFGVPADRAAAWRPAYDPGPVTGLEGGLSLFIEITPDWLFLASLAVERLDDASFDSPIVETRQLFKGFTAINYVF